MTKVVKRRLVRAKLPNFIVQREDFICSSFPRSGDLLWKGYATTEEMAFKKAFSSFKAALAKAGIRFKDYVA